MSPILIGAWAAGGPAPSVSNRAAAVRDGRRGARMRNLLRGSVVLRLSKAKARRLSSRFSPLDTEHTRVVSSGASGDCLERKTGDGGAGGGDGRAPARGAATPGPDPARAEREDRALPAAPLQSRARTRLHLDRRPRPYQPDRPHPAGAAPPGPGRAP